jgi:hypothetical protein
VLYISANAGVAPGAYATALQTLLEKASDTELLSVTAGFVCNRLAR